MLKIDKVKALSQEERNEVQKAIRNYARDNKEADLDLLISFSKHIGWSKLVDELISIKSA
jgi:hypothetical protein